jgi:UPF0755 protein
MLIYFGMSEVISNEPAPLDPSKYHVLSASSKKKLFILVLVLMLVLGPILGYFYYSFAVNRPAQSSFAGEYIIREGTSVTELAQDLQERGLINSNFLFKFYLKAKNLEGNIQAGVYQIPAGSSIADLATIFQRGKNDSSITFIEGWRVEEMALAASEKFENVDYRDFIEYAKQHEGYLFPDTYFFNAQVDEEQIIDAMRANFDQKTSELLTDENLSQKGLTKDQVVIFASILEREINTKEDMPIVAGILIQRFKDGELIGADATTQFVMANDEACSLSFQSESSSSYCLLDAQRARQVNWWPKEITLAALEKVDPYNTRKVVGLPPKPISSPGLAAIEAVVNYQTSDYYFYLTDSEGITRFGKTLEEHNANVAKYL